MDRESEECQSRESAWELGGRRQFNFGVRIPHWVLREKQSSIHYLRMELVWGLGTWLQPKTFYGNWLSQMARNVATHQPMGFDQLGRDMVMYVY